MRKISKIPGFLQPPPKTEIDGKITDLSSKTVVELLELRDRQLKLLNNKPFISKLADKGLKIQVFYDKIVNELKIKQDEEQTCNLFNKLNIDAFDKQSVQNIEWNSEVKKCDDVCLDSDDDSDEDDVIKILTKSTAQEKIVKVAQTDKPLITQQDLISIGEDLHTKYIVNKTEYNPKQIPKTSFKPYKTTKSDVHNPEKELLRKKPLKWEVTAATPPPIVHGPIKVLALEESLQLQKEYNSHLKKVQTQHAYEKLLAKTGLKMAELPEDTSKFGSYREVESDGSVSEAEGNEIEIHDEEPERGGVIFTIMK